MNRVDELDLRSRVEIIYTSSEEDYELDDDVLNNETTRTWGAFESEQDFARLNDLRKRVFKSVDVSNEPFPRGVNVPAKGKQDLVDKKNAVSLDVKIADFSNRELNSVAILKISRQLEDAQCQWQELNLSDITLEFVGYLRDIFKSLSKNTSVVKLTLSNLKGSRGDRSLEVSHCDVELICKMLEDKRCQLEVLNLGEIVFSRDYLFGRVLGSLSENTSVKELILSDFIKGELGYLGLKAICDLLESKQCQIERLDLSHSKVTDKNVQQIIESLQKNSSLKALDLSNNEQLTDVCLYPSGKEPGLDHAGDTYLQYQKFANKMLKKSRLKDKKVIDDVDISRVVALKKQKRGIVLQCFPNIFRMIAVAWYRYKMRRYEKSLIKDWYDSCEGLILREEKLIVDLTGTKLSEESINKMNRNTQFSINTEKDSKEELQENKSIGVSTKLVLKKLRYNLLDQDETVISAKLTAAKEEDGYVERKKGEPGYYSALASDLVKVSAIASISLYAKDSALKKAQHAQAKYIGTLTL